MLQCTYKCGHLSYWFCSSLSSSSVSFYSWIQLWAQICWLCTLDKHILLTGMKVLEILCLRNATCDVLTSTTLILYPQVHPCDKSSLLSGSMLHLAKLCLCRWKRYKVLPSGNWCDAFRSLVRKKETMQRNLVWSSANFAAVQQSWSTCFQGKLVSILL